MDRSRTLPRFIRPNRKSALAAAAARAVAAPAGTQVIEPLESRLLFNAGDVTLMSTFSLNTNNDGVAIAPVGDQGALIGAGDTNPGSNKRGLIFKLMPNGTLDTSYGNQGTNTLNIAGNDTIFTGLVILPDGS